MFPLRLCFFRRLVCFLCFLLGAYAQVIYDNPPIGVPITRPIFPWLARVYVKSGEQRQFLDAPPPNLSGNGTQSSPQGQPNPGTPGQQGPSPQASAPNQQPPPPEQTQLQPYGSPPPQNQLPALDFIGYPNFAQNVQQQQSAQPIPSPTSQGYAFPQVYSQQQQFQNNPYQQQLAPQQQQQQQAQQYYSQQQLTAPQPTPYGPPQNLNPGVYSQMPSYSQPNSLYDARFTYPQQTWSRFSSVPMLKEQLVQPQLPTAYPVTNSVLPISDRMTYGLPLDPYSGTYDLRTLSTPQTQQLSPLPTLTSDPVLGPPPSAGVPNQPYSISYTGQFQSPAAATAQVSEVAHLAAPQQTQPTNGYYYNALPTVPNRFHDLNYYQPSREKSVIETPFGTASTSTLSILKELAVALEKVTRNQK